MSTEELSNSTIAILKELHENEGLYKPSAEVSAQLANKTMIMLVGATCMGKGTLMQRVTELHPEIHTNGTITSRGKRPEDHARYEYYPQTDRGLAPLIERIRNRELVQYAVNPANNCIYATAADDYQGDLCIGDILSSVVPFYPQYGFGRLVTVSLVTEPGSLRERINQRFPVGHEHRITRLEEGRDSLQFSLSEPDNHYWAINRDNEVDAAVYNFMDALAGKRRNVEAARQLARDCLAEIEGMLHAA